MKNKLRALYIGKFQPFHKGHLECIKKILNEVDELIIAVGSAQYSHTLENPFTAGERMDMIRLALEENGIDAKRFWIIAIPDVGTHSIWVAHLKSLCPNFSVVYTNNSLVKILFEENGFKVREIPLFDRKKFSATEVRRRIISNEPWEELVPPSVAKFIKDIKGDQRLRELFKKDIV
ncbi:MAG: nicotinamide-nucleotide adenylyltransferase [Nitrososphaerota archaeon]